ncbi:50S ribosomal protein L15e [Candidatus Pacearchaeota archaeon]|nr:50S ribosomal protein L15e [Candidatus Pacearchaeota archaeon]|tara:strand:- start:5099 stop:5683 length:585 start_codon:yes stop_codon:yes gene_type:complete
MVKGLSHYLKEAWKKPGRELLHGKMIQWRAGDAIEKVERPLRLDKARAMGYKAKRGVIVVRVRINRGGRKRQRAGVKGRKTRKQTIRKTLKMNYRQVAEIRAARKYKSLEVLNSYWIGKDGKHYFYEVILIDTSKAEIKSDRTLKWIVSGKNSKRAERGLTSAGKKGRGLKSKRGKSPTLKVRPSLRARSRQGK